MSSQNLLSTVRFDWNQGYEPSEDYIRNVTNFLQKHNNGEPIDQELASTGQVVSIVAESMSVSGDVVKKFARKQAMDHMEDGVIVAFIPAIHAFKYARMWAFDYNGKLEDEFEPGWVSTGLL